MDPLLNPNIAYLVLVAATFFVLLALMTPGTGVPELLAIFSLLLAFYAVYHLSFNWWALAILLLSLVPFWLAVRGARAGIWLAVAILGFAVGSIFIFPSEAGVISVNPLLALGTTVIYAATLWICVRKIVEVAVSRPIHELSSLIGQKGEAKTVVQEGGSVQVAGELWSARSERSLKAGSPVRVIGRDGFVLVVELDPKQ
jgi:membrane-bound serine protease (ClpP class)